MTAASFVCHLVHSFLWILTQSFLWIINSHPNRIILADKYGFYRFFTTFLPVLLVFLSKKV